MRTDLFTATLLAAAAGIASAAGTIENPQPLSTQSGIGVISGWNCTAQSITIQIDDFPALRAGARTERNDTAPVCGRADTGFSLLYNFNLLDPSRPHRIVAFADGVEFARVEGFSTANLGAEYLTDLRGRVVMNNFPAIGETTVLQWEQEKQDFTITAKDTAAPISGTYYGAEFVTKPCSGPPALPPVRQARYDVVFANARLRLDSVLADGESCTLDAPASLDDQGYVRTIVDETVQSSCSKYRGDFRLRVNGARLDGEGFDFICNSSRALGAK